MSGGLLPKEVSQWDWAFPSDVSHLLPAWDEIPAEFKNGGTKWNDLFNALFFCGLRKFNPKWNPKVDGNRALRHIQSCMRSFHPEHQHKEAGVAYLFSLWMQDCEWERKDRADAPRGGSPSEANTNPIHTRTGPAGS